MAFTRRSTLGDRAFPVASARVWNSLPSSVRNAPSLTTFRRELKTVLFRSCLTMQWLGDRDCTAQYNCCLLTVGDSVFFSSSSFLSFFKFYTVPLQCLWRDSVTLISTLLLTYLLSNPLCDVSLWVEQAFSGPWPGRSERSDDPLRR